MFHYRRKEKKIKFSKSNWLLCALIFRGRPEELEKGRQEGEIPVEEVPRGISRR